MEKTGINSFARDIHVRDFWYEQRLAYAVRGYIKDPAGRHVHPENCMTSVRKYDYDAIWQKHLETGYNARQLSELVFPDIPVPSIYAILVKMRKSSNH